MTRTITEIHTFTRENLEQAGKLLAKTKIISGYYIGDIGEQEIAWKDDGSLVVTTTHTPGERK